MASRPSLFALSPALMRYAWGDPRFLPDLLQVDAGESPIAEAWYGAHPAAPATVITAAAPGAAAPGSRAGPPAPRPLDQVLAEMSHGDAPALPYLLKVLAAARPLSIQVHPNADQARAGFAAEEEQGIPRDAPHRRYRDPNHKPELVVALTPFAALCGFRAPEAALQALRDQAPELADLLPSTNDLRALVAAYLALPDEQVGPALFALVRRLERDEGTLAAGSAQEWALQAHRSLAGDGDRGDESPPDRGLLFVFLLEQLTLEPGQALFLPAGVPHAYMRGAAVEVMASSDNVLRAGLTRKHVDPDELMRIVRFDARRPPVIEAVSCSTPGRPGERRYPAAATDFDLRAVDLDAGQSARFCARGFDTVLALPASADSRVTVSSDSGQVCLGRGQACLVTAGEYSVSSDSPARLFRCVGGSPAVDALEFRGRRPTELAFGTSGLRGRVEDITDLEAYVNARGFLDFLIASGRAVPGTPVALAGDLRPSTERLLGAVCQAAKDAGMPVSYQGRIPSPALMHFAIERGWPSIMVTGSHIPFDRNGIKFARPDGEVLKDDEAAILASVARVRDREYARVPASSPFDDAGAFRAQPSLPPALDEAAHAYRRRYVDGFAPMCLRGLRLAFFEHSAVGRDLIPDLLSDLGADVVRVGRSDVFVAIDTEALSPARLRDLQAFIDEARERSGGDIDALVSTDGDSDRPLIVAVDRDGRGHFIGGDIVGTLVADSLGASGAAVPVSSTDLVERYLTPRGIEVTRTRIGSPWVIAALANLAGHQRVGWEANGGFLTGSPLAIHPDGAPLTALPTRDAVLPIVALLRRASEHGSLYDLTTGLPPRASRATLLDDVPADESAALMRAFGAVESNIQRERLEACFTRDDGFGRVDRVDDTDGLRVYFDNGDIAHVRPSGNAPQLRLYAVADTAVRAQEIVAAAVREPDGLLRRMLDAARDYDIADRIGHNLQAANRLLANGGGPGLVGVVSGTESARHHWQHVLDRGREHLGARSVASLCEDLPVNQAFGVLLMWQRIRERVEPGAGALMAFVFGEGSRATPLTEAEAGQKPAIASCVAVGEGDDRRFLSTVEVALRTFAPVEAYLRRSGFDGVVVKWGDEVQVPTLDLTGADPRLDGADVVRFVSMRPMTDDSAANKDWVGVAADGRITAFIPRRPLARMAALADRGLLQRRGDRLWGGVNLGSVAMSRPLLDALLDEFRDEVNDPDADRRERPDLDPQLFTALVIASIADETARAEAWRSACADSPDIAALEQRLPGALARLRRVVDRVESSRGRPLRLRAVDFGDQYWGDIGQHRAMFDGIAALNHPGPRGDIARAIAGVSASRDERGNRLVGTTRLGVGADVENSVLIDAAIEGGHVRDSVLIGTRAGTLTADGAFDIESTALGLSLARRAGSYKVVADEAVAVGPGERLTTLFVGDAPRHFRVHEDTDLRDRSRNYDRAIAGNTLSFAEAHRAALAEGPEELERKRRAARARVASKLGDR